MTSGSANGRTNSLRPLRLWWGREIWNWVEANAITILTGALVLLTGVLAGVGLAEVRFQREATSARRRQLRNDIYFLGTVAQALPGPTSNPDELTGALMRGAIISWDDFSFDRFRMGAAEFSKEAGQLALVIEWAMKRLGDRLNLIRSANSASVFDRNQFDWLVWNNSLNQLREALLKIENELGSGLPSRAEMAKLLLGA